MSNNEETIDYGPLAGLIGEWEGNDGTDISPGKPDYKDTDTENKYKERRVFEAISPAVENHDQKLRQIVGDTNAWRGTPSTADKNAGEPFHAQRGYWVWDPETDIVLNSFAVPRGIVINAGGRLERGSTTFDLVADAGGEVYGICQNPFLLDSFKVVRYTLHVELHGDTIVYNQDTHLQIRGRGYMHHTDENTLHRVA